MQNNNLNIDLELLSKIEQVDAPHFLMTRIQQKIENRKADFLKPRWVLAISASLMLIIAFNFFLVSNSEQESKSTSNVVQAMNMETNNSLY